LPATVVSQVEAVPVATLVAQAVKRPADAEPPQALKAGTAAFTVGGKPAVVFVGAEYCPYCASERWPLVMALSKFGTFEDLRGSMSSTTDLGPRTPSFSFYRATYTSRYLSFLADEMETGTEQPLQAPTAEEQALVTKYDTTPYVPAADAGLRLHGRPLRHDWEPVQWERVIGDEMGHCGGLSHLGRKCHVEGGGGVSWLFGRGYLRVDPRPTRCRLLPGPGQRRWHHDGAPAQVGRCVAKTPSAPGQWRAGPMRS
jgi:hypothetical protein